MKILSAFSAFKKRLVSDYESHQRQREKYWDNYSRENWLVLLVKDISIQSMAAIRVMQLAKDVDIPYAANVISQFVRFMYKIEVHPDATIEPGITLIHGVGLVIGKHAHVGSDCIIAHNVTLEDAWDEKTKKVAGPILEENIHIGPGVNIIGAITVGTNSKIMAGVTLKESVPPFTLVKPTKPSGFKKV